MQFNGGVIAFIDSKKNICALVTEKGIKYVGLDIVQCTLLRFYPNYRLGIPYGTKLCDGLKVLPGEIHIGSNVIYYSYDIFTNRFISGDASVMVYMNYPQMVVYPIGVSEELNVFSVAVIDSVSFGYTLVYDLDTFGLVGFAGRCKYAGVLSQDVSERTLSLVAGNIMVGNSGQVLGFVKAGADGGFL